MSCESASAGFEDKADLYRDSFKHFKALGNNPNNQPACPCKRVANVDNLNNNKIAEVTPPRSTNTRLITDSRSFQRNWCHVCLPSNSKILVPYPPGDADEDPTDQFNCVLPRSINLWPGSKCECYKLWGLRHPDTWKVFELSFPEGLIVIKNPFTRFGQRYWITRALIDFPHDSNYITNMDNLNRLQRIKNGQAVSSLQNFKLDTCSREFYEKLRWVTFGFHHDWDTKIYSEDMRSTFPEDLADMSRYLAQILGFSQFEAEAAIANYYHMDSTLSGHVDKSEVNQEAPLFSLSFGQSAIFLIGGKTKAEKPQPILLQSGDVAIMSGQSRLSYHGVPKILPAVSEPWNIDEEVDDSISHRCKQNAESKRPKLDNVVLEGHSAHNCESFSSSIKDSQVSSRMKETTWTDFVNKYVSKSRINLNIRQVLFPGQICLDAETSRKNY